MPMVHCAGVVIFFDGCKGHEGFLIALGGEHTEQVVSTGAFSEVLLVAGAGLSQVIPCEERRQARVLVGRSEFVAQARTIRPIRLIRRIRLICLICPDLPKKKNSPNSPQSCLIRSGSWRLTQRPCFISSCGVPSLNSKIIGWRHLKHHSITNTKANKN